MKQFISQPLVSKTEITERQNLVQFLVESAEVRNNLSQSILQKIPDIGKINIRISQMQQSENTCGSAAAAEAGLDDVQVKMLDQNGLFYFRTANRNESKIKKFEIVSGSVSKSYLF